MGGGGGGGGGIDTYRRERGLFHISLSSCLGLSLSLSLFFTLKRGGVTLPRVERTAVFENKPAV